MSTGDAVRPEPSIAGRRILVVEDELLIFLLVEDLLTSLGCTAVHACSLAEAMDFLNANRPDAAILDVNLSGKPVYPLAEVLRAMGIPFVFATGYEPTRLHPAWRETPVVQKPFALSALADALRSALGRA